MCTVHCASADGLSTCMNMNTPEKKLSLSSEAELGDPTCGTPQTSLKHRSLFSEIELFRTICQMGEHPTATRHKGERRTVDFQPDLTSHTHHAHTDIIDSMSFLINFLMNINSRTCGARLTLSRISHAIYNSWDCYFQISITQNNVWIFST